MTGVAGSVPSSRDALPRGAAPDAVVVVGGGIVGACCALALLDAGCRVTLVEPGEPGGPQAASFGNGAWISPASVIPMATPGLAARVPGLLADREGPLTIRPAALPSLAPWLWRFVNAGRTWEQVARTTSSLGVLLRDAPARHAALAASIGQPQWIRREGLLYAYPDAKAFEAEAALWHLRQLQGVVWQVHEGGAARERAPWLSSRYACVVEVAAGAHCLDPGAYVRALVAAAQARGCMWVQGRVLRWLQEGRRLSGVQVRLEGGMQEQVLPARRAVLAAGMASGELARALGDRLPLAAERGYHIVLPLPPEAGHTLQPVMPSDGKMAITRTSQGLRIAGQVELARLSDQPDWRRADVLWRHAARMLSDAAWQASGLAALRTQATLPEGVSRWMGHRPSSADGLPYIGPSPVCPDVVHAFGHGHVGLAAAPITAAWVAQWVTQGQVTGSADEQQAARLCEPRR
jgi:D-amino-acid dehydrogenase